MDIFLSYSRAQEGQAREIGEALRGLGYSVWRDDQLPPHRPYADVIEERLSRAKAVLVLWSKDAVRSEWVRSEADRGRQQGKLVQWAIEPVALPMPFDQIQCADGAGGPSSPGWPKVLASLDELLGRRPGQAAETPLAAGASPAPPPHNLPQPSGALVGRGEDVQRTLAALSQARLVTIVGAGGVGKTRLGLEAARARMGQHADGIWLAELAGVADPERVPEVVAKAANIDLPAGAAGRGSLVDRLQRRDCLLVLDNCEHLILAVAELGEEILSRAPNLRLLLTSREPLGIDGEQVVRLGPLAETDAAALFVARAQACDAAFAPSAADHQAIATICRRLDGVPLAIEMAAARAPMLGCGAVLRRLDDRFRVLTGGRRTALPRQQTLQATLDWSHDLLSERDATVFRRLGVFAGDFSAEAASAIAADDRLDDFEVMDALASLVAKSLVIAKPGADQTRYSLLETTREYAVDRLEATAEIADLQRAHAQWYARSAQSIWPDFTAQISDEVLLSRYLPEFDNLHRAIDWAFGPGGEPEVGLRILADSRCLWDDRALKRRLDMALPLIGEATAPAIRAKLLAARAHVAMMVHSPDIALRMVDEAIEAVRASLDDPVALSDVLASKAGAFWFAGHFAAARPVVDEMIALTGDRPPSRIKAQATGIDAALTLVERGPDAAAARYDDVVSSLRAFGADGLASYWQSMKLRLIPVGDPDLAIEASRDLFIRIRPGQMYAGPTLNEAARELALSLAKRGTPADIEEAMSLATDLFKTMVGAPNPRALLAMAMVAAKSGRAEHAALILGYLAAARVSERDRTANEALAETVRGLLPQEMDTPRRAALIAEGGALSKDEVILLALGQGAAASR